MSRGVAAAPLAPRRELVLRRGGREPPSTRRRCTGVGRRPSCANHRGLDAPPAFARRLRLVPARGGPLPNLKLPPTRPLRPARQGGTPASTHPPAAGPSQTSSSHQRDPSDPGVSPEHRPAPTPPRWAPPKPQAPTNATPPTRASARNTGQSPTRSRQRLHGPPRSPLRDPPDRRFRAGVRARRRPRGPSTPAREGVQPPGRR